MKRQTEKRKRVMDVYHALGALHDLAESYYQPPFYGSYETLKDAMLDAMKGIRKMNIQEVTALKEILEAYHKSMY